MERVKMLLIAGLVLLAIDQLLDTGLAAAALIAVLVFALFRWSRSMPRWMVVAAVAMIAVSIVDLLDSGLLPVLRIRG